MDNNRAVGSPEQCESPPASLGYVHGPAEPAVTHQPVTIHASHRSAGRFSPTSTNHLLHTADVVHNILSNLASFSSISRPGSNTCRSRSVRRAATTGTFSAPANVMDPGLLSNRAVRRDRHSSPGQPLCVEDMFGMPTAACQGSLSMGGCVPSAGAATSAAHPADHPLRPGPTRLERLPAAPLLASNATRPSDAQADPAQETRSSAPPSDVRTAHARGSPVTTTSGLWALGSLDLSAVHQYSAAASGHDHLHASTPHVSRHGAVQTSTSGRLDGQLRRQDDTPLPILMATYPLPERCPKPSTRVHSQQPVRDLGHPIFDAYFDECDDEDEVRLTPERSHMCATDQLLASHGGLETGFTGMETALSTGDSWTREVAGDGHAQIRLVQHLRTIPGTTPRSTTPRMEERRCHRSVSVVGLGAEEPRRVAPRSAPVAAAERSLQCPARGSQAPEAGAASLPYRRSLNSTISYTGVLGRRASGAGSSGSHYDPERVRTVMHLMRSLQG